MTADRLNEIDAALERAVRDQTSVSYAMARDLRAALDEATALLRAVTLESMAHQDLAADLRSQLDEATARADCEHAWKVDLSQPIIDTLPQQAWYVCEKCGHGKLRDYPPALDVSRQLAEALTKLVRGIGASFAARTGGEG